MQIAEVVDYGAHVIEARVILREINDCMNEGQMEKAEELALKLVVESKLLLNAIKHK
jgi:hypothetical protein